MANFQNRPKTTKANPLLTCGKGWPSMSHALTSYIDYQLRWGQRWLSVGQYLLAIVLHNDPSVKCKPRSALPRELNGGVIAATEGKGRPLKVWAQHRPGSGAAVPTRWSLAAWRGRRTPTAARGQDLVSFNNAAPFMYRRGLQARTELWRLCSTEVLQSLSSVSKVPAGSGA